LEVLVTGGAGFIGSNIVDKLIDLNYEVIIIDNLSTGKIENINKKANFYNLDIKDKAIEKVFQSHNISFLIHTAAQIDVQKSFDNPSFDAENNILGTINILNNCVKYDIEKIIYSSSAAVYGEPNYLPIDEEHSISPISPYGISKFVPEKYIQMYNKIYNLNFTILRYSNAFGPRQDAKGEGGVISIFIDRMLNDKLPVIFGDGEQTRDFIYVSDIVSANINALAFAANKILNISSNNKISINYLVSDLNNILKSNIKPIFKKEKEGDIKHSSLNNIKAKESLNWKPRVSFLDGLRKTIEFNKNTLS